MKRWFGALGITLLIVLGVAAGLLFSRGPWQEAKAPTPQPISSSTEALALEPYPPPITLAPYPPPPTRGVAATPSPPATPSPTLTQLPTLTLPPLPPTPTAEYLPPLDPHLDTLIYATTGDRRPELYRVQGDIGSGVLGAAYRLYTPELWHSRVYIDGLYPSPDGKRLAVVWFYGDMGTSVSILDVQAGKLAPLFGENATIDQMVHFLSWSPDGNDVLVLGFDTNPDDSAWLVNVNTHEYSQTDIKVTTTAEQITSASFSPDGKAMVYAKSVCYGCGSEVWRITVDGSEPRRLLFEQPDFRIEGMSWSPGGNHIAFTQWRQSASHDFYIGGMHMTSATGELWIMNTEGGDRHLLSSAAMTGYYGAFPPSWSHSGRQIAFIGGQYNEPDKQPGRWSNMALIMRLIAGHPC